MSRIPYLYIPQAVSLHVLMNVMMKRQFVIVTEIAVKSCYFPPYLFPSYCAPETTPEMDKQKGKWVVVEKDLNLRDGIWYVPRSLSPYILLS
jgi:hypothetical protein